MFHRTLIGMASLIVLMGCYGSKTKTLTAGPPPESVVSGKTAQPAEAKTQPVKEAEMNPFFEEWTTAYGMPPFDRIRPEHYRPAFDRAMQAQKETIARITANPDAPTFANTVEPFEYSGVELDRVGNVFFLVSSADANDELQKIRQEIMPVLTRHQDDIYLDEKLFARIRAVHDNAEAVKSLSPEQRQLLAVHYRRFVRGGALLNAEQKKQLRAVNEELASLTVRYNDNLLAEGKRFEMLLTSEADLEGIPESVRSAAADAARARGKQGWLFTLDKPSWIPFLQYSKRRDLREKLYRGYITRGDHGDDLDNKKIIARIAALRVQQAKLLGFSTFADYVLDEQMAKTPKAVFELLDRLWKAALPIARNEAAELQKLADREKPRVKLASWDWWYYAEQLRKKLYDLDEEQLRPYFQLDNVIAGIFAVAGKLYGLKFEERKDLPKYNPEVRTYEVKEADGRLLGILLMDFHPRPGKRTGAWMGEYRQQMKKDGRHVHPIVTIVCNFTRPTGDAPALLSFEEVETLFHEFGHSLHGLFSDCTYPSIAGTSVPRDFVELPSQIMEHWASEPEVLRMYAKHYKTGEVIPQALIDRMAKARHFNQGFETVEYLAASYLDMRWHTLTEPVEPDTAAFEKKALDGIGLIPEIVPRYRSTYFAHIVGGYAAGYYSYIWAAVLDNDAFEAFKEAKDIFHAPTAARFRKLLSSGYTEEPMALYERFRGARPKIEPLLRHRGLIK